MNAYKIAIEAIEAVNKSEINGREFEERIAPLRDVEPIIRCKDCKHYRYYGLSEETVSECTIDHCEKPDGNWFCADGEPETH